MAVEQSRDTTDQNTAGPQSALEALKAFKEVQERRIAHWKEYDEALEHYERTNLNAETRDDADEEEETTSTSQTQQVPHRCGPQPGSHSSNGTSASHNDHYHSVALPMTDEIFSKILSLVTSGLLDCSHSARTIETELRTALQRPDLARMVGQVQDHENSVLRKIVERDQTKRIAKLEGRDLNDAIQFSNQQINQARERIQESMEDIAAEMAEL
ncbi:uncharacterized protein FA14DRAFT_182097 [Meira miltonrushii]|uniref:Uncharacterized protein n=1 Tax=Meira miltonrushii TaxID=1280837 RepID=A0A316V9M1_9BASI|nr:uncharacterized protein FA14DRAFT_182097 [Meira miltonrushii]PWN32185.1 hypothetical protein FA14DRAFT_182097 [Meira miltonrushii]